MRTAGSIGRAGGRLATVFEGEGADAAARCGAVLPCPACARGTSAGAVGFVAGVDATGGATAKLLGLAPVAGMFVGAIEGAPATAGAAAEAGAGGSIRAAGLSGAEGLNANQAPPMASAATAAAVGIQARLDGRSAA